MKSTLRAALFAVVASFSAAALHGDRLEGAAAAHEREREPEIPAGRLLSMGGPVMTAPRVVPIVFAGDADGPRLTDFVTRLVHSAHFGASVAEYGVAGPLEVAAPVVVAETPAAVLQADDVAGWLAAKIAAGVLPPADGHTVYAVTYPDGTEIDVPFGRFVFSACFIAGALESRVQTPDGSSPFIAVPRCDGNLALSGLDEVTVTLSKSLAAVMTNPDPNHPAYIAPDLNGSPADAVSFAATLGEICVFQTGGTYDSAEAGGKIARLWSNRAAAAGYDGCQPTLAPHRFGAYPLLEGANEVAASIDALSVHLEPGGETTVPVRLFGDRDGPRSWDLSITGDWSILGPGDPNGDLSFSFDEPRGGPGDVRHLTIRRSATSPFTPPSPLSFAMVSTAGGESHVWPVLVGD